MKKLNTRGFSQHILFVAIIVVFGIVGAYVFVRSHAATCVDYQYGYNSATGHGSGGICVNYIQILANHKLPYIPTYPSPTLEVDGHYGPKTKDGILRIQKKWGLTQDGIVGPHTWKALCSSGTTGWATGGPFTATEFNAWKNAGCSTLSAT
ncbi:MAG TPA: peptidoglycan-binding domain-containing protein [Candidatus Saccharimonadales bacterium]|nr:peptidoglycan-binding domain-containing protein [Candidatus Saccharimonadales bacterium]